MTVKTPEVEIFEEDKITIFQFKRRHMNLEKYFKDFTEADDLTQEILTQLINLCQSKLPFSLNVIDTNLSNIIEIKVIMDSFNEMSQFKDMFLEVLRDFYEENEVHITRMFGSFIYIKKIKGELKAIKATPIPIKYCPLMKKLLIEIGGETAKELLDSLSDHDDRMQSDRMCELINEVVIRGGYFDTSRPLNSCEANVLFGASETMSSAFNRGLIDAAVIVSNNLGTIITTNESNTQGAVKRMTGLFLTSPSKEIVETAISSGIVPAFPHTASIDQLAGVKLAISMGYKKIAVSVAWHDNILLNEIKKLEKDDITIYRFGLCSTGIDNETAEAMLNADIVWSCASKAVKEIVEPNAIAQVGIKIPVHVLSKNGWNLIANHLDHMLKDKNQSTNFIDQIKLASGREKPIILNDPKGLKCINKSDLKHCVDCPNPCV